MELNLKLTKQTWLKVLQTSLIVLIASLATGGILSTGSETGLFYEVCCYAFNISWVGVFVSGIGWVWSKDDKKRSTLR